MAVENTTNTTNTTATNTTNTTANITGAPPPAADAGQGIADRAISGTLNGLDVARQMAGDIVRSVVPEFVLDRIPFLLIDALDVLVI